ncbi:MAG TPA: hypothetical protein VJ739_16815 [Gemmataceae bacterium]|nr:hypothetical protein [Gemmataceae bacterium]
MSRERVPKQYEPALYFFKWLVLAVTLGPLLLCVGCIGLGAVLSFFSQPAGPQPERTAPELPAPSTGASQSPYPGRSFPS